MSHPNSWLLWFARSHSAAQQQTEHLWDDEYLCAVQFSAQHPCLEEHAFAQVVLPKLCHSVLSAASISQQLLVRWWSTYPKDILADRVVRPLQSYITVELQATKKLTLAVMNSIKVRPAMQVAAIATLPANRRSLLPQRFFHCSWRVSVSTSPPHIDCMLSTAWNRQ